MIANTVAYSQTLDTFVGAVETSASGADWVPIGAGVSRSVHLHNDTGTTMEVRLGGSGPSIQIAASMGLTIRGIRFLSDVEVRRTDTSNTQVTMPYVYETTPIW